MARTRTFYVEEKDNDVINDIRPYSYSKTLVSLITEYVEQNKNK
jgi:hypothetical protein